MILSSAEDVGIGVVVETKLLSVTARRIGEVSNFGWYGN